VACILVVLFLMYVAHPSRKYYSNNTVVALELGECSVKCCVKKHYT
jgi:hypothetical protein